MIPTSPQQTEFAIITYLLRSLFAGAAFAKVENRSGLELETKSCLIGCLLLYYGILDTIDLGSHIPPKFGQLSSWNPPIWPSMITRQLTWSRFIVVCTNLYLPIKRQVVLSLLSESHIPTCQDRDALFRSILRWIFLQRLLRGQALEDIVEVNGLPAVDEGEPVAAHVVEGINDGDDHLLDRRLVEHRYAGFRVVLARVGVVFDLLVSSLQLDIILDMGIPFLTWSNFNSSAYE